MATATAGSRARARAAHKRGLLWGLVVILVGAMVAPLGGYVYVAVAHAESQETATPWQQNPRADTWRQARQGDQGTTQASGPYTTSQFIQNGGENWRSLRNGPVAGIMPWVMAFGLVVLGAVFTFVGPHRVEAVTGRKVPRWAAWERAMHWFVAVTFIVLAITGLSLLFGRAVLIPLLGHSGFSAWAIFSKWLHNIVGPFFSAGILLMIIVWIRNNIPKAVDMEWFKRGGGLITKEHVSAEKLNGGEKVWFWFIVIAGSAVCITGLIMDFPNFGQSREAMQISNIIHAVLGIIWITFAFGHIYLGTVGASGALEGMTSGYVSEEWAREHHDLWYEEVRTQATSAEPGVASGGPAHGPAQRHD